MNIFDAHISGSLSVSSSAEIQGDLRVLGIINATISGNTTSADTASFAPRYTLTSSFYAYSGTTNGRLTAIETSTASLNTFTSSADGRLNSIEGVTGSISSLNTYTGSNNTVIGTLQTSTASLNTFTSSASDRLVALETSTGSINTYTSSNTININAIHTSTASLNTYTGSNNTIIGTLQTSTGSLNTYTSSNTTNINAIHTATASLNSFSSSAGGRLTSIEGVTGSIVELNTYTGSNNTAINALNSYTSSNTTNINAIHTATSSLNSYTSSNTTNINAIHTATSSLNSFTSSASGRLTALETASSSLNSYTSSNTTAITALNSFTTSFNTAFGLSGANVTVKGNLTVQGSTTQVDSTTVNIGDNIIQLNGTGATNAGIVVRDATSPTFTSGSLLWDSTNDKWVAGPLGSEDEVVLKTASQALTNKTISGGSNTLSNIGNSSLTNSSITIAGTSTSLGSSITAATILTSTGVWSGSAQLPSGVVSGSAQVIANLPSGTVSGSSQVLSGTGIWSGSAQLPSGVVSGSSQVSYTGLSNIPAGIVSGSSQITFLSISSIPSGLVSGSSQVLAGTTIHSGSFFNGISVVSGSSQISFNGITDKPALVSGSSQITYGSLSGIPSGIVSGSSQISFGSVSGIPSGLVSGSSQITFLSISNIPSGLVSGSSQITGIGNSQLVNSSFNIGTTSISLGRSSASQTLTGVSIDGASATTPTLTSSGTLTTQAGSGTLIHSSPIVSSEAGLFSTSDNSNSIITFNRHPGNYYSQLGFNSTGTIFYRSFNNTAINTSQSWKTIIDSSNIGSQSVSYATTAGALTSMNISQFTNNSGYITGISFANVSSKPTTISGYGITDAITTGNISAQSVSYASSAGNATTVSNLTAVQLYNNMGEGHSTRTSFDASTPSYGFGYRFVQGSTNGPGTGGGQFYSWYIGLGNDYPATGAGSYGAMFAVDRNVTTPYLSVRYNESNSFTSWRKIYAGYADSAGSVSGANVSGNISGNASNITSYTINQSVGSSNTPTFAGVNLTDRLYLNAGSYEGSILFGSSTTWRCGIRQHDDADAELRIWTVNNSGMIFLANGYNGEPADISRPTDGLVVVSNNVGIGNFSAGDPSYKLHVKGSAGIEGNLLLNNGGYGWIYGNDTNHSIIMRGDRNGTAADYTNYYQYGGSIASGKGHKFWTGGVLASQTLKFHIGDDYTLNTGNMTIGGTLTENSSIRYKKDIENITYGLDKVLQLRGVTYVKKENNVKEMGVIAEEIAEILPDVVLYDSEGKPDSVSYGRITAVLIEAIKDLKKELNELKNNG